MEQTVDPKEVNRLYPLKAKESFKTRFDLLLFKRVLDDNFKPITEDELEDFSIEQVEEKDKTLTNYINIYWQKEDYVKESIGNKSINDIYLEMKAWRDHNKAVIKKLQDHYVKVIFPTVFPKDKFVDFMRERHECEYCHITKKKIDSLIEKKQLNKKKHTRGWSLEIDRKEPNLEYTRENCVWCCYWCNNAKTDEFSYDEFKKIGEVIKTIWDERLNR